MNKVHLLGANRSYDRDVQTVSVNQVEYWKATAMTAMLCMK